MGQATLETRVSPGDLSARRDGVTILDVRTPAEFESVHIPGSYNLPLDRLGEHVAELRTSAAEPVVLVCRSGQRAQEAERQLVACDLPGLTVLEGGLTAWEGAGLPVVRGAQRWSMERQVRGVAGALVLGGLIASLKFPRMAALSAAVGGGLLFSAVSDTCMMAKVLGKLPYNQGAGCDVSQVIRDISARRQMAQAAD
ncbi:MAG: rhodanese-like domain-containing protein [Thermomicrobiales bacterium]